MLPLQGGIGLIAGWESETPYASHQVQTIFLFFKKEKEETPPEPDHASTLIRPPASRTVRKEISTV